MPLQLKGLDIVVAGVADTKCSVSMTGLSNSNLRDFELNLFAHFFGVFMSVFTLKALFS